MKEPSLIEPALHPSATAERGGFVPRRLLFRPWLWLNLTCLDAPLVAVSWQLLFAQVLGVPVAAETTAVLFLTAWIIYLADRLADALALDLTRENSARHRFCRNHLPIFMGLIAIAIALDAWLLLRGVDTAVLRLGLGVSVLALAYLTVNYLLSRVWRALPLKEITIGVLFAAGTLTPVLPQVWPISPSWLWTLGLFALLCSFNCTSLAVWERALDEAQGRVSLTTRWPGLGKYLVPIGVAITLAALVLGQWNVAFAVPNSCTALSAVGLLGLHLFRNQLARDDRAAGADLVLLTPLLVLGWGAFG